MILRIMNEENITLCEDVDLKINEIFMLENKIKEDGFETESSHAKTGKGQPDMLFFIKSYITAAKYIDEDYDPDVIYAIKVAKKMGY